MASVISANPLSHAVRHLDAGMKVQNAQGLIIQNFCLSVDAQPPVDLAGWTTLAQYGTQINPSLGTAKTNANYYLNTLQPLVLGNLTNLANYYGMHQAVPSAVPPGSSKAQWIAVLQALQQQAHQFKSEASTLGGNVAKLAETLATDSGNFASIVLNMNAAVSGDNGVLSTIDGELGSIQGKIDGCIAGTAASALAILGGVFMCAVGAIADFVTAGTSTPLVYGGAGVIAAGIGGEVASAEILKNLLVEKANLLTEKSTLKMEVNLALGIKNAYNSLSGKANNAAQAAAQMESAWDLLAGDLGSLANDLEQGIHSTSFVRTLFLDAAQSALNSAIADVKTVEAQMTGVNFSSAPAGTNLGPYLVDIARQAA